MAKLQLRGKMWYSYFKHRGKRIHVALDRNRIKAEIAEARLREKLLGAPAQTIRKDSSWSKFKVKYLTYSAGAKRHESYIRDRSAIRAFDKHFRINSLSQITPEVLEQWKAKRAHDGKKAPTIARDLQGIKALLRKAVAWGYMDSMPWDTVKQPKLARGRLLFYSRDELLKLLKVCHGPWKTACLLGSMAGLRRGEIHTLEFRDIDFDRNRLHVVAKDGWAPKDYDQRFVPLASDLRAHLETLGNGPGWVLGEDRPSPGAMSVYFKRLAKKAGLRGGLHTLRHTFASHLVMAGVDIYTVSKLLGHSDVKTTQIYAHLAPEKLEDAVSRLKSLGAP